MGWYWWRGGDGGGCGVTVAGGSYCGDGCGGGCGELGLQVDTVWWRGTSNGGVLGRGD